jgi:hypothetical protein
MLTIRGIETRLRKLEQKRRPLCDVSALSNEELDARLRATSRQFIAEAGSVEKAEALLREHLGDVEADGFLDVIARNGPF